MCLTMGKEAVTVRGGSFATVNAWVHRSTVHQMQPAQHIRRRGLQPSRGFHPGVPARRDQQTDRFEIGHGQGPADSAI
ncbi:hypothetical protein GCM10023159_18400 [Brevibacterium yomogidense]